MKFLRQIVLAASLVLAMSATHACVIACEFDLAARNQDDLISKLEDGPARVRVEQWCTAYEDKKASKTDTLKLSKWLATQGLAPLGDALVDLMQSKSDAIALAVAAEVCVSCAAKVMQAKVGYTDKCGQEPTDRELRAIALFDLHYGSTASKPVIPCFN